MPKSIICDTTVWLYLGQIDQASVLASLYSPIYTTETVCLELDTGRLLRPHIIDPRTFAWVTVVTPTATDLATLPPSQLGLGERSVMAYATTHQIAIVGLDDQQARLLAKTLGLHVMGTLGVLIQAKRAGYIESVRPLLEQLKAQGFYMSQALFEATLQQANESESP